MSYEVKNIKDNVCTQLMKRKFDRNKNVILSKVQNNKKNTYGAGKIEKINLTIKDNDIYVSYGKINFNLATITYSELINRRVKEITSYIQNAVGIKEYSKDYEIQNAQLSIIQILINIEKMYGKYPV